MCDLCGKSHSKCIYVCEIMVRGRDSLCCGLKSLNTDSGASKPLCTTVVPNPGPWYVQTLLIDHQSVVNRRYFLPATYKLYSLTVPLSVWLFPSSTSFRLHLVVDGSHVFWAHGGRKDGRAKIVFCSNLFHNEVYLCTSLKRYNNISFFLNFHLQPT